MNAFNAVTTAIFDLVMAPFGHGPAWFDLVAWSVGCGVVALVIYKYISNQAAIARVKDRIKVHLLEIRLFRHDPMMVVGATGRVFLRNFVYMGHNLLPMVVLLVPMLVVLIQLEAHYAFAPGKVGDVELFEVALDSDAQVKATDVTLDLPEGVRLDAPPVRTADGEIFWRLEATAPGDHVLTVRAGEQSIEKTWAVGNELRKVPVKRTRSIEALLYPGEPGIPATSPFYSLEIPYPERELGWIVTGELGVLMVFFVLSLVAGFALKDVFGVTL
ncbi:MAG: hypothetical protein QGG40_06120 [Myxococcota bacterium]|nr:hypothetical protein [Myxococcota bacterium]